MSIAPGTVGIAVSTVLLLSLAFSSRKGSPARRAYFLLSSSAAAFLLAALLISKFGVYSIAILPLVIGFAFFLTGLAVSIRALRSR